MSTRKIVLKSSDGESFEVEEAVALQSQTIAQMVEDGCVDNGVPLPNVTSKILAKVIEYCKKHVEARLCLLKRGFDGGSADEELKAWDADFMKIDGGSADEEVKACHTVFELFVAANYLKIENLLDLTFRAMCDMIEGKTLEENCALFNIKYDLTPP